MGMVGVVGIYRPIAVLDIIIIMTIVTCTAGIKMNSLLHCRHHRLQPARLAASLIYVLV